METAAERLFGAVNWFDSKKGFGFLSRDDGGPDVFVHVSAVERAGLDTLREGQRIEFELATGPDGRARAENLAALEQGANRTPGPPIRPALGIKPLGVRPLGCGARMVRKSAGAA
jgi:CspA family cold shock protein